MATVTSLILCARHKRREEFNRLLRLYIYQGLSPASAVEQARLCLATRYAPRSERSVVLAFRSAS